MWGTDVTIFIFVAIALVAVWLVWRMMRRRERAEPREEAGVPTPIGRGPRSDAGAVALDEPEEKEPPDSIGRKL